MRDWKDYRFDMLEDELRPVQQAANNGGAQ
jgi:hypothetical protein